MSAPARRARTAALGTVNDGHGGSARSSVIATPWNRARRAAGSVHLSRERPRGAEVVHRIEAWLSTSPGTAASNAARKGNRSRRRSSARPRPTVAGPPRCLVGAEPRPGKCAAAANTPARCRRGHVRPRTPHLGRVIRVGGAPSGSALHPDVEDGAEHPVHPELGQGAADSAAWCRPRRPIKSAGALAGGRSGNEFSSPPSWPAITSGGTRPARRATTPASPAIWPERVGSCSSPARSRFRRGPAGAVAGRSPRSGRCPANPSRKSCATFRSTGSRRAARAAPRHARRGLRRRLLSRRGRGGIPGEERALGHGSPLLASGSAAAPVTGAGPTERARGIASAAASRRRRSSTSRGQRFARRRVTGVTAIFHRHAGAGTRRRNGGDEVRRHLRGRCRAHQHAARRIVEAKEAGSRVVAVLSARGQDHRRAGGDGPRGLRPPAPARDGHAAVHRRADLLRARGDGDQRPRARGDLADGLPGRDRHRHLAHAGTDPRGAAHRISEALDAGRIVLVAGFQGVSTSRST